VRSDDDLVTLIGLFMETQAGLSAALRKGLERDLGPVAQWLPILIRLARSPEHRLRMNDLAAQTGLSASGLTRAVDRLEDRGLVERRACPTDSRGLFAVLTPEGHALMEPALEHHAESIRALIGPVLDDAEIDQLEGILRKLRDATNPAAVPRPA
jgi:MarR family 2-MHQ and catechol resistance regulon transcriptional repressor